MALTSSADRQLGGHDLASLRTGGVEVGNQRRINRLSRMGGGGKARE